MNHILKFFLYKILYLYISFINKIRRFTFHPYGNNWQFNIPFHLKKIQFKYILLTKLIL